MKTKDEQAQQHTAGRLAVSEPPSPASPLYLLVSDAGVVAQVEGLFRSDQKAANARRLVACWNACEGIPTEQVEAGVVGEMVTALRDCLQSLKRLPDAEGAYRVTCISQAEAALRKVGKL